jgi:hypothetical protein
VRNLDASMSGASGEVVASVSDVSGVEDVGVTGVVGRDIRGSGNGEIGPWTWFAVMATSVAMTESVEVSAASTAMVKAKVVAEEEHRRGGKVGSPPQNPPPSEAPPHSTA